MRTRLLILFCCSLFLQSARGIEFRTEKSFEQKDGETLEEELWLNADEITIKGTVNDDLFFFGNQVSLGGTYSDDVWGMAKHSIKFSGDTSSDLRVYAQKSIKITGNIGDDAILFGDTIQLDTNSVVQGSAMIKGRAVVLTGKHEGDVRISAAESITINAFIDGEVFLECKDIQIEPGTRITGNLNYKGPRSFTLKKDVRLDGELIKSKNMDPVYENSIRSAVFGVQLLMFMTTLLYGMLFLRFIPRGTSQALNIARTETKSAMMIGSASLLGISLFAIVCFASVLGIPMGILFTALAMLLVTSGKVVIGYGLGQRLLKQQQQTKLNPVMQTFCLFVGLLAIYLATMIPLIGGFIWFMVSFFGVGTILMTMIHNQKADETPRDPAPDEDPFAVAP